jgi:hypothetical protein
VLKRPLPHRIAILLWIGAIVLLSSFSGDRRGTRKPMDDVYNNFTTVGNIGLTVTNFGTFGDRNVYWPQQPSCVYPRGSGIEHEYQGALWVGARISTANHSDFRNGQFLVSTGASDQASTSGYGYEFNNANGDSMAELSTLAADRPVGSSYTALAISHQDFVADYTDMYTRVPATNDSILDHHPLGLRVHQESYAWNFPFADFFVILRYDIYNASPDTLDSVYVGLWNNAVVRNTNLVHPGTTGYYDDTGEGYDSLQGMAYSFDANGEPGGPPADSYIGLKLLGCTPFPTGISWDSSLHNNTFYNVWQYQLSSGDQYFLSPTDDYNANPFLSRYSRLTQGMPNNEIAPLRLSPRNVVYLLSTGPFTRLNPGDSLEVVYAVVCATKDGTSPASLDLPSQRATLNANAAWAQRCYQGDDINGNNTLDPGENIARRDSVSPTQYGLRFEPDPNNRITRYLLPSPPRTPKVHAVVGNQTSTIYWDKATSEYSVDPITGVREFEGYRIYRSNVGQDISDVSNLLLDLSLVADFDKVDNMGYNTGFSQIQLPTAKMFPGDTTHYWYQFPPPGVKVPELNGWQYVYAVSAYSTGDSAEGVPSLESNKAYFSIFPGTPPTSADTAPIIVYPNPYIVSAAWDGTTELQRKLYFANLPARCEIMIYTLSGDVVQVIDHNAATYNGSGIQWTSTYAAAGATPVFSGGEHAWDLITKYDQAIATGLYLFTVKDLSNGNVRRGKFLVIK